MSDFITQGLATAIPSMFMGEVPLPPGVMGPLQQAPNALAKGLGGVGQAAGMGVVSKGLDSALGTGEQPQASPMPGGPVARPPAPPPNPIQPTAFNTPSARRPVPTAGGPGGGGQGMAGMSLQQMMELRKKGLL